MVGGYPFNRADFSDLLRASLVTFADVLIYQDGKLLHTEETIWFLNCYSELLVFPLEKADLFGIKRPIHTALSVRDGVSIPAACAGHIKIEAGKITYISFSSGHFAPVGIQFALALAYFNENGVVYDEVKLGGYEGQGPLDLHFKSLEHALSIASMIDLG